MRFVQQVLIRHVCIAFSIIFFVEMARGENTSTSSEKEEIHCLSAQDILKILKIKTKYAFDFDETESVQVVRSIRIISNTEMLVYVGSINKKGGEQIPGGVKYGLRFIDGKWNISAYLGFKQ